MNPDAGASCFRPVRRPVPSALSALAVALCFIFLLAAAAPAAAQPVSFNAPLSLSVGDLPSSVAVGDFNGDSDPDLAVTNSDSGDVSILLGAAGGSFEEGQPVAFLGGIPSSIAVGDFNGDSDLDLAVTGAGSGVLILLGAPGG